MSQGTRIPTRLYSGPIGALRLVDGHLSGWPRALRRAEKAPGDVKPGLLASTIEQAGGRVGFGGDRSRWSIAPIVAANRNGGVSPLRAGDSLDVFALAPGAAGLRQLDRLLAARGKDDFVYAVRAPYGTKLRLLPSEICNDETFLRRVTIDIAGLLPTEQEYLEFVNDKGTAWA